MKIIRNNENEEEEVKNFTIQKLIRTTVKISVNHIFDVEIQGGHVKDRQKRVSLMNNRYQPCQLISDVQKVVRITEKDEIGILHGSLSKLQKR